MASNAASQAIDQKYRSLGEHHGFLGLAIPGLVADIGFGGAPGFHVDYIGGSIYWSATTGAHVIYGDILTKWLSVGGPKSNLGYPKTDEAPAAGYDCRFMDFAINRHDTGAIYWTPASGAQIICGPVWLKWLAVGGVKSVLRYPTSSDALTPDGKGHFNNFHVDGNHIGSIYWTPAQGAYLIYGYVLLKWISIGGAESKLGYPITDQVSTADNICLFANFATDGNATGSIYWSPFYGARIIYGQIYLKWVSLGGEAGALGYPTTDEFSAGDNDGRYNDFSKGGSIYWSPATGAHAIIRGNPTELEWASVLTFPSSPTARGWIKLKVFSNGAFQFTGNLHDSSEIPYDYSVAYIFLDADKKAWTVSHSSTFTPEPSDNHIDRRGNNPALAENWRAIVAGDQIFHGRGRTSVIVGDVIIGVARAMGAVGTTITLV